MITGSLVAIVTPMLVDGSVDWNAYGDLIEFHIANGTAGIVSVGTTGESSTLEPDTHIECLDFTVKKVAGRIAVIAGTGSNSTREAIHQANAAKRVGVDAHLSVAPYYNRPDQRGMLAHFKTIASACDLPMILYNVPARTSSDIEVATVIELAEISHIVGIKEASDLARCQALLAVRPQGFFLYCGNDALNYQTMVAGFDGVISVTANVAPRAVADVCRLAASQPESAKVIDDKLQVLHRDLFIEPSPAPTKWALSCMGLCREHVRLPILPLHGRYHGTIENALSQAGVL